MEKCVAEMKTWMNNDMLKLDDDKTELFLYAPHRQVDAFKWLIRIINIYNSTGIKRRNNVNVAVCSNSSSNSCHS